MLRLIDLLAIAVDDMRQGGDPRLPLELALVKITRPQADLSRDSLAHRLEVLESRPHGGPVAPAAAEPRVAPADRGHAARADRGAEESAAAAGSAAPARRSARAGLDAAAARARSAPRRLAAGCRRRRQGALDPDLDARRRGAAGRDPRRRGHDRVRPGRRLPPGADRGPEEPRACSATRCTRSRGGG